MRQGDGTGRGQDGRNDEAGTAGPGALRNPYAAGAGLEISTRYLRSDLAELSLVRAALDALAHQQFYHWTFEMAF